MILRPTGALLAVLAASVVAAQRQPNFSGTWLLVAPAERANQSPGQEETITQSDMTITLGHPSEGGGHRMVYRLDGQETENLLAGMRFLSRASWNGQTLVLVDRSAGAEGSRRETTKSLQLDHNGDLIMEVARSSNGQPSAPARLVWRKR